MKMPPHRWVYRAKYDHAHDGDTVTMYLDRGINEYTLIAIRLLDCYAPELDTAAGKEAQKFTRAWMDDANDTAAKAWPFRLETFKPDPREKYGRWLGRLWAVKTGYCLNEDLIAAGHATVTP